MKKCLIVGKIGQGCSIRWRARRALSLQTPTENKANHMQLFAETKIVE